MFPVHPDLDEAGLTPYEFRVYCHIARLDYGEMETRPLLHMAEHCDMSREMFKNCLAELLARRMIVKLAAPNGKPVTYGIVNRTDWL